MEDSILELFNSVKISNTDKVNVTELKHTLNEYMKSYKQTTNTKIYWIEPMLKIINDIAYE
eukprot:CAMPEP_0116874760 /NCGR_PEP_ID=MMETSP0463-20121206/6335_1 /TAXON_ID=181622 /ORGANISM="Strombidinopsis sp, Strain SopsisLIS2011" /LENGTH=60 /DNA_ID=CAMNT_0004518953 /DNA_START=10 /DNA_END=192 /DNA_ORIENTATION=+